MTWVAGFRVYSEWPIIAMAWESNRLVAYAFKHELNWMKKQNWKADERQSRYFVSDFCVERPLLFRWIYQDESFNWLRYIDTFCRCRILNGSFKLQIGLPYCLQKAFFHFLDCFHARLSTICQTTIVSWKQSAVRNHFCHIETMNVGKYWVTCKHALVCWIISLVT